MPRPLPFRSAVLLGGALTLLLACRPPADAPVPVPPTSLDPARPLPSPLPSVLARVNGRDITQAHVTPFVLRLAAETKDPNAERPRLIREALEQYVDRELLLDEAMSRGLRVSKDLMDFAYDQTRAGRGADDAWAHYLKKQGFTEQSFREDLRVQVTVNTLLETEVRRLLQAAPDQKVPDDTLKQMLPEVRQVLLAALRPKARIELYI
jgi:SurA N-terminal domain